MSPFFPHKEFAAQSTRPWQWPLPQRSVFFATWDNGRRLPDEVFGFAFDLGVGGAVIASGSRGHPTHSCDRWVGDLGVVDSSSIFGWVRGTGVFTTVLPTFVLVSRMKYRANGHFLSPSSFSRHKAMVGGVLTRDSPVRVGVGVSRATIVSASCARPSHSWISRSLTSSLSLGISSLFCRATQWGAGGVSGEGTAEKEKRNVLKGFCLRSGLFRHTSGCVWCGNHLVVVSHTMTGGFQMIVLEGVNTWSFIRPGHESSTRSVQLIRRWGLLRESAPESSHW